MVAVSSCNFLYDEHLIYFEDALAKNDRGDFVGALASWNCALAYRETPHARWNRGQALLSLGDYPQGFGDYAVRFKLFPDMLNPGCDAIRAHLPLWEGQCITGKRLVLLGEQGFGDVVMLARFVPALQALGIDVRLAVPKPLQKLLSQIAPIGTDGDFCAPFFDVLTHLAVTAATVPGKPYLRADPWLRHEWLMKLPVASAPLIGIAWKSGKPEHERDFKRTILLEQFVAWLDAKDAQLVALQPDDRDRARALGVLTPEFTDFADVAAVASVCDMVVCCDVAAINVAGAIGHPNAHVVLPYVSSWRWLHDNVWYPHVHRCQQERPGDWASAFAQLWKT